MTFVIDAENSITAFTSQAEAGDAPGEKFGSQQELAALAASWPAARLVEIWNSIPGLTPVKKFTDRKAGLARIWKAIQSLNGDAAAGPAAPKQRHKAKGPGKSKPAKGGKGKRAKTGRQSAREGSKKAQVLALLQRKGGATLNQLMEATDWQAHSVRGAHGGIGQGRKRRAGLQPRCLTRSL
jgi:hypothetical protein